MKNTREAAALRKIHLLCAGFPPRTEDEEDPNIAPVVLLLDEIKRLNKELQEERTLCDALASVVAAQNGYTSCDPEQEEWWTNTTEKETEMLVSFLINKYNNTLHFNEPRYVKRGLET